MTDAKDLKSACGEIADIFEFYGIELEFTDEGINLVLGEAELELTPNDDIIRALRKLEQ